MKKLIPLFLMLCCLVSVTACSKDEIVSNYNQALQSIGDKGLQMIKICKENVNLV